MTEKERMLKGLCYSCLSDDELEADKKRCRLALARFNSIPYDESGERMKILKDLLGGTKGDVYIEPPFYCDYGKNIFVGENFYANFSLHILDCARVTIGDNVLLGPMCGIYAAGHPIDAGVRSTSLEYGKEIVIGNDVWIGGSVTINPGVKIGSNVVIGSGSVVTKDIPDNCIAFGNPCTVHREISDEDKKYWKKQEEDYLADKTNRP